MSRKAFLCIFFTVFLALLGCAPRWVNPNTTIPAAEFEIATILAHSIAFDSAGVIVVGKVWDVEYRMIKKPYTEIPYTLFKLADMNGNYINVFAISHFPVIQGDFVRVLGTYRRDFKSEDYTYVSEIEAKQIKFLTCFDSIYKTHCFLGKSPSL